MGFRLIFQGTKLNLDTDLVPVLSIPETKKARAMMHRMKDVVGRKDKALYPLFFVGLGIQNGGDVFHPFENISQETAKKIHRLVDKNLYELGRLEQDCQAIWKTPISREELLNMLIDNELSIPAGACYAARYFSEKNGDLDFGLKMSLRMERVNEVFEKAVDLERKYDFFKRYRKLAERLIKNQELFDSPLNTS